LQSVVLSVFTVYLCVQETMRTILLLESSSIREHSYSCSFRRKVSRVPITTFEKRFWALRQHYYLLLAGGPAHATGGQMTGAAGRTNVSIAMQA
jgi:hypothetical protein